MTVKVRSSVGNKDTGGDITPEFDSPGTIIVSDLLTLVMLYDDDTDQSLTPASGWSLRDELASASVGTAGRRYLLYTKIAVQDDVDNQGTADFYVFTDGEPDDLVYGVLSLRNDAGGIVEYVSGSLAHNVETGGGTTTIAPTQIVSVNASMSICAWSANEGTNPFAIDVSESYSPSGGDNPALLHGAWTSNGISNLEWVVGTAEWNTNDSPIGLQTLNHNSLNSNVDEYSVSMMFKPVTSGGIIPQAMYHYRHHGD